jgi:imidazoleglycerol phosphate synthase glutamine amidotransferase subunit HisH
MISIFDYGAGNLRSVQNTLGAIGAQYELIRDAGGLRRATRLILPGVGHFGQMMRALDELEVRTALIETIRAGAPEERGLGIFEGQVRRFQGELRIPHMGWNQVEHLRASRLLDGTGDKPFVYFAHSYYVPVVAATAAICEYSVPYTAVLEQDNIYGVQCHPEKSGELGLRIVRNFVET